MDAATSVLNAPDIKSVSDSALLVEFENRISEEINTAILTLKYLIDQAKIKGVTETVASYRSLLVHYDCLYISAQGLATSVLQCVQSLESQQLQSTHWRIPVCYRGEAAIDLEELARYHSMSTQEVIQRHMASPFRVYMVGFAPGWCYLGGLDSLLHTPRLASPRKQVPPGCIAIGGQQSIIGGLAMPSGWRLIGQTPVKTYMPERDPPFFIQAGDRIECYEITPDEYPKMAKAAEQGHRVAEVVVSG